MLDPPDPAQAGLGVGVEERGAPALEPDVERLGENQYVGYGEIETLGSSRRDDVRGVAGQEEATVAHGVDDEAAHRRDAPLEDRPVGERPRPVATREPRAQFGPDPFVGPFAERLVRAHLKVQAGDIR